MNCLTHFVVTPNSLFISISSSTFSSFPLTGSHPFSKMYFSMIRLSNIAPDKGEITGCSGTSFVTKTTNKNQFANPNLKIFHFAFSHGIRHISMKTYSNKSKPFLVCCLMCLRCKMENIFLFITIKRVVGVKTRYTFDERIILAISLAYTRSPT